MYLQKTCIQLLKKGVFGCVPVHECLSFHVRIFSNLLSLRKYKYCSELKNRKAKSSGSKVPLSTETKKQFSLKYEKQIEIDIHRLDSLLAFLLKFTK